MIVTQAHIDHIIRRAQNFGARRLILFGSALETPENARDIDLAADVSGMELYAFAGTLEHDRAYEKIRSKGLKLNVA